MADAPFSLIDEGDDHFMVQDNSTGQQRAVAKDALPKAWQEKIRGFPKIEADTPKPQEIAESDLPSSIVDPSVPHIDPELNRQYPAEVSNPPALDPSVVAGLQGPSNQPTTPAAPKIPSAVPPVVPDWTTKYQADLQRFLTQSQAALSASAGASSLAQKNIAATQGDYIKKMQDEQDRYLQSRKALDDKVQTMQQDVMNTKIDPGHWWAQQTGASGFGKRVLAFIGMVLGGASQLRTGVNPTGAAIDKLINEDIDAQKENLGTKKNILNQYLAQYGNIDAAHRAAYIDMASMVQAQLGQIAATAQSQIVQQNAKLAGLQLGQSVNEKMHELSMQVATMGAISRLSGGGAESADLALLPKEMQEKVIRIPDEFGGGMTMTHSSDDKNKLAEAQESYQALQDTISRARQHMHGGPLVDEKGNPLPQGPRAVRGFYPDVAGMGGITATGEEGKNYQKQMQGQLRELLGKLRPTTNADAILNMVPNVSEWNQEKAGIGLNQLESYARSIMKSAYSTRTGRNFRGQEAAASKFFKPGLTK